MMEKPITTIDLATLTGMLHGCRNHFLRVVWESNFNDQVYKTNEYKGRTITKVHCMVARNDFSFRNSVLNELERRGASEEGEGWEPQQLSWGERIPFTPFSIHCVKEGRTGEPERLYAHFLPAVNHGRKQYHHVEGECGFYIDSVKCPDEEIESILYERRAPETELERARHLVHPVRLRLDDIMFIKIAGHWYKLKKPSKIDIENVKDAALEYAASMEAIAA